MVIPRLSKCYYCAGSHHRVENSDWILCMLDERANDFWCHSCREWVNGIATKCAIDRIARCWHIAHTLYLSRFQEQFRYLGRLCILARLYFPRCHIVLE